MKNLFVFLFISSISLAQTNTEIHIFDIKEVNEKWLVNNGKNISNNPGYDSQPHFYDNNTILFSSNRNGEVDIAKYDVISGSKSFISNTPNGG
ncbi:hypothetical protein [Tenacibaculum sp. nBUS_03]|uniref:hypothetical protein n=1 Tax=Tenacibaculum sp. nBUS_03 TaxID=3395320 RepID=UPI003EB7CD33